MYKSEYSDKETQLITIAELENAIAHCNNKSSTDTFGLSNLIIKKFPFKIKLIVLKLFNKCLSDNFLPTEWKKSIISMIPKKGNVHNIKNYRPISSTPNLMKLFERIIANRLKLFLESNKILIKQ